MFGFRNFSTVILLFVSYGLMAQENTELKLKVLLSEESELVIHGETNVNKFHCVYTKEIGGDTLEFILNEDKTNAKFINSELKLDVDAFDCGSAMINDDFRKLLQMNDHPYVTIDFVRFQRLNDHDLNYRSPGVEDVGYFDVAIQVAGVYQDKIVNYERKKKEGLDEPFKGSVELDIREFGLSAPQKFMGLVKVKEEIRIELLFLFLRIET